MTTRDPKSDGSSSSRDAFRALVIEHQRAVHAVIAGIVFRGSIADVDDLAQEAFVRVHRALRSFEDRGPGALRRWILTIAARVAVDHVRSRKPMTSFNEQVHCLRSRSADELARFRQLSRRVEAALDRLSPDQRAVLVLRDLYELDYREIAESTGADLGTVKSRLHRARAIVRNALEEERSG